MKGIHCLLLLGVNLLLALENLHRVPGDGLAVIFPLVPPLTHVPAMSLPTLDPEARPMMRDSLSRAVARVLEATHDPRQASLRRQDSALFTQATALRLSLEADAIALAGVLGPTRVKAFVAARPLLSAAYGEVRVWEQAAERVAP